MKRFLNRLSPSMVVALVALFVALGGTGYAAFKLPANSVGTKQLKNGAVTAAKVKTGSLLASSFKAGQLLEGPKGDVGPMGPQGSQGPKGDPGTVDTSSFYTKSASDGRFLHGTGAGYVTYLNINGCGQGTLVSYPITISTSSLIVAFGSVAGMADSAVDAHHPAITAQLLSGSTVVAQTVRGIISTANNSTGIQTTGVMLAGNNSSPYAAAPGTYTLRLQGDNLGQCAGWAQYQGIGLSNLTVPSP